MALFYEEVIRTFVQEKIRFVIVGGTAVILHGVPRTTADIDFVIDLDSENVLKAVNCLSNLGYKPRAPVEPSELAREEKRNEWLSEKGMMAFSFFHPDRPLDAVDILYASPVSYAELKKEADLIEVSGLKLIVASEKHLIKMKTNTGRPQDEADIDALRRILNEPQ